MEYDNLKHLTPDQWKRLLFEGTVTFIVTVYERQYTNARKSLAVSLFMAVVSNLVASYIVASVNGVEHGPLNLVTMLRNSVVTSLWSVTFENMIATASHGRSNYCAHGKRPDGSLCNPLDQVTLFSLLCVQVVSVVLSRLLTSWLDHFHIVAFDDRYQKMRV